ncbi:MAG TPA: branched-chain amino acid ABC transporter permease [Acidimicrobiia bacterium]|nr:branched-chain amino acid ABC transporter permease [Acidimicrobiia bacterium]
MLLALQFHRNILAPAVVNGVAISSLYALMAIALVLTFRMSRSVAFVHGGIASISAYLYWYLAATSASAFAVRGWPKLPSLFIVIAFGAMFGFIFGTVVMGRMAGWPRVTVTTFSLGAMLLVAGIAGTVWRGVFETVPSPFGVGTYRLFGMNVTRHQVVCVALLVVLSAILTFVLSTTRLGVYIRAIADDVEAGQIVGIPTRSVAIGVWTFSGALAGLGGALIVPMSTLTELAVLFVLMRSLAAAVLGGFDSLPLALVGALIFGLVESVVGGGVFGPVSSGAREVILMGLLFGGILLIARRRGIASLGEV